MATADQYKAIHAAMCEYLGEEPRDLHIADGEVCLFEDSHEDECRALWRAERLIGDELYACEECFVRNLGTREWIGRDAWRLRCEHVGDGLATAFTRTEVGA